MIYTARYRYPGRDRLDITVKGNDIAGRIYAPTWGMVKGFKDGTLSEEAYTEAYYKLLLDRWDNLNGFQEEILRLVDMIQTRDVTVVCFCPANTFCHRYLLINFLKHNWKTTCYGGEREI